MLKNLVKCLKINILEDLTTNQTDMIIQAKNSLKSLVFNALNVLEVNKTCSKFFIEIMFLFLSIKGRLNFLQFARYGKSCEQKYRQNFEKHFDFMNFNSNLIISNASHIIVIAFDPSYVSKSGKKTYGYDKFWSGVASQAKFGLEIGGIAAVDIDNNTAFHLEAIQTPTHKELQNSELSLVDHYAQIIVLRKDTLKKLSNILVVDGYFSKKNFIDKIVDCAQMKVISRLRTDADLWYLYKGKPTGKRGRPKKYISKIDLDNIDSQAFKLIQHDETSTIYELQCYSKSLKRKIKVVLEKFEVKKQKHILFFSTDLELDGLEIRKIYKSRFQIEFLYRDAKQFTGLNDCQARSKNKLHFHFNASLTAVNLAKFEHWVSIPKEKRGAFSMSNVKTLCHNALLLERFFDVFAVNPKRLKNINHFKELLYFGTIAA